MRSRFNSVLGEPTSLTVLIASAENHGLLGNTGRTRWKIIPTFARQGPVRFGRGNGSPTKNDLARVSLKPSKQSSESWRYYLCHQSKGPCVCNRGKRHSALVEKDLSPR